MCHYKTVFISILDKHILTIKNQFIYFIYFPFFCDRVSLIPQFGLKLLVNDLFQTPKPGITAMRYKTGFEIFLINRSRKHDFPDHLKRYRKSIWQTPKYFHAKISQQTRYKRRFLQTDKMCR